MANVTALDIVRQNAGDDAIGIIEESMSAHPEVTLGAARTISGVNYTCLVRTALPSVGFRDVNEGVDSVKSTWANRIVSAKLIDASAEVDAAAGQIHDGGIGEILANEQSGLLEAGFRSAASQFYYGQLATVATSTAASYAKGFPGLIDTYDSTNMEVDAGGSTGTYTSVWLVKFGRQHVEWVFGRDGEFAIGETMKVRLTDGSDQPYDGYRKPMTFWIGLQNSNPRNSAVRIKKIDATTILTDAMIDQAIEKFPVGVEPDVCLMTRRSARQLKSGRTATTPTGATAPWPTVIEGLNGKMIPIALTDAISESESA